MPCRNRKNMIRYPKNRNKRFALPVYDAEGELERYNVFHASMLIRHSNDGKMYLYDVIDIKKETSNSLGEYSLTRQKPISFMKV